MIIVGISGHQNLSKFDINWINKELLITINKLPIALGMSSLAIGSDQLFAELIIEKKIPLNIIIPCTNYEKTFTSSRDLEKYKLLLGKAAQQFKLDYNEPTEQAFYAAGKSIVKTSNLLITIWDGLKAKGLGGTGDIVEYALERRLSVIHLNPLTKLTTYHNYAD
ncbi:hypothetical protein [Mucilaginibacter sp. OK283]|jgi:hypothetical protein|uniref:hypothetical protein n=1 Tax=Mucilaginibacter sp. OK283 TaxID=1881049 RepID=UPI0008CAD8A5|nr:hypothetical protein [Mucilaginibacter sp. OK283]SEO20287.1 hypothetical protein SAMN05428947_101691 [Mucilaginibacter sp. OK283]